MSRSGTFAESKNKYARYLAKNGLRSTAQRDLIINEFFKSEGHVTAEELHLKLRGKNSSIGLATVYRTLKTLESAGLAHERQFNDGFMRYEFCAPGYRHHDHIVCLECGLVEEFENNEIENLQIKVANKHNFTITDHRLELYGVCERCKSKTA